MRVDWLMAAVSPPGGDGGGSNIFSRDLEPEQGGKSRKMIILLLGSVLVVMLGVWLWLQGDEDRALKAMAPAQRQVLFQETQASFRTLCLSDAGPHFQPRCQQQAVFLHRFSECDDACRQELAAFLPRPTR
jgi:hypothetical protein